VAKLNASGGALVYSTYLGGSNFNSGEVIAVDPSGNAYVAGNTNSSDFPTTSGAFQRTYGGTESPFVAKINAAGNSLVYSTYLGTGQVHGIAADASGFAYVTGETSSSSFPLANALQSTYGGNNDAFVTKLNTTGTGLVWSTFLGGNGYDQGYGIAVDSSGNTYIGGDTTSTNFPTVHPIQGTYGGGTDAFVAKINAAGTALVYSTYLGGSDYDITEKGFTVDSSGEAYIVGYTASTNFPTANPLQGATHGGGDAFVTKLNAAGTALVYSTYLGGGSQDFALGVAVDSAGEAYVVGRTMSADFPIASPLQNSASGMWDAFATKLNASGNSLAYSTYLGGSDNDEATGVALDSSGDAFVVGFTSSSNFPTANSLQPTYQGGTDAFVTDIGLDATTPQPIMYTAPSGSGANNLELRLNAGNVELLNNNVVYRSRALSLTTNVQITGAASVANGLTINNTFGGLIPLPISFTGGSGGNNSATITGTSAADSLALSPTAALLDNAESITFQNVQSVTGLGAANDAAFLYDEPGVNSFLSTPTYSILSGNGYSLTVGGFGSIQANAGANASDSASLYDTVGGGVFVGRTDYSYLRIGALINQVVGFKSVLAGVGAGLNDSASLIDPKGGASFTAYPGYSYLLASGLSVTAQNFIQVKAYAPTGSSDSATLFDTTAGGQFTGYPGYSYLQVGAFFNTAVGFAAVVAYNLPNDNDPAYLLDNVGGETYTAYPGYAFLQGGGFSETASGFRTVTAANLVGGADHATFYDTTGGGVFGGRLGFGNTPGYSTFQVGTFVSAASGFPSVFVAAPVSGKDVAYLSDSGGVNNFFASPDSALLGTSDGSASIVVQGFVLIQATSTSGADSAFLHDSGGDDAFNGTPTDSNLEAVNLSYIEDARGFAHVYAAATSGNDRANLTAMGSNNTFAGSNATSLLMGANYSIQVSNFFDVNALNEGNPATAFLYDTLDNDVLSVLNTQALLYSTTHTGMNYILNVSSFNVSATATGMNDVEFGAMTSSTTTTSGFQQAQLGQQAPNPPGGR
jgi:hypothetical protein